MKFNKQIFLFTIHSCKLLKLQWHVIQMTRRRYTLIQFFNQTKVADVVNDVEVCNDASVPNSEKHRRKDEGRMNEGRREEKYKESKIETTRYKCYETKFRTCKLIMRMIVK